MTLKELFRADARAEAGKAYIGGWETFVTTDPKKARWFAIEIEKSWAPWVWAKEADPNRIIATLELLGTLFCIKCFADAWPKNCIAWRLPVEAQTTREIPTLCRN